MTTKLGETAKQAGAIAFSRSLEKDTYTVLTDDVLFVELADLWDCATLETLETHVAVSGHRSAARAFMEAAYAQNDCPLPSPAPC